MKPYLLYALLFTTINAIGQTSDDIQRKIDSLQAEKRKIDVVNNPIIIEKLQKANDSLNIVKNRLLKQIESINLEIDNNNSKILGLKLDIPVPEFKEITIVSRYNLPFKKSASFQSNLEWIPAKSTIVVLGVANEEWVQVRYEHKIGYILASFLDAYPEVTTQVTKINQQKLLLNNARKSGTNSTYSGAAYSPSNFDTSSDGYSPSSSSSGSRTIYTGPRGGRYYINKNGNKTYIKRK